MLAKIIYKIIYIRYRIPKLMVNIIDCFLYFFPIIIGSSPPERMKKGIPNLTNYS